MVATPVKDRTPFYEPGEATKAECPRCHFVRQMMRLAPACSGCMTEQEHMRLQAVLDIKQRRHKLQVSHRDLARESGFAANTIWFIESGRTKHPKQETLKKMQEALDFFEENLPTAEEIVQRREALRISMSRLARHAGIGETTLNEIERGHTKRPHRDTLLWINGALEQLEKTMPLIEDLKERRVRLGISMTDLELASGLSRGQVWRMESGRSPMPNPKVLKAMDEALTEMDIPLPDRSTFRARREAVKMKAYEVANLARIHRDTLCEVETGKRKRSHRNVLFAIDRALRKLEGRLSER